MKYLLPLMFLVGCETHPKKRYEDQLLEEANWIMEQVPRENVEVIDDSIKIEEPSDTQTQIDSLPEPLDSINDMSLWSLMPVYRTVEIDVSFFTHRRYMVFIHIMDR